MTKVDEAGRVARRAALFGSASRRVPTAQPIPRRTARPGTPAADAAMAPAILAADRNQLRTGTTPQLEHQVLAILAASKQRTVADLMAGDLAADGSLAIDSMSAVFVCRIVARVLGPTAWRSLRGNCEPKDFVSVHAVAALIGRLRRAVVAA